MAWSSSEIFREFVADALGSVGTGWSGISTNTIKVALYASTITPNQDAATNNTGYNTGQWVTGGEKTSSTDWPAGGQTLSNKSIDKSNAGIVYFDNTVDTASGSAATMSDVMGCLVYNDSVSSPTKPGLCYNWFTTAQSVSNGTFTIVWAAPTNGIFKFTL